MERGRFSIVFITVCFYLVSLSTATFHFPRANQLILNLSKEPPLSRKIESRLVFNRLFNTKLDHFDEENEARWDMRYFSNDAYFVNGGPMFIFVGGNWPISYGWVLEGHMVDMAKDMKGYIFYTEHRYYGESKPTPDTSTSLLQFLSSDQAMEDLAQFIIHQKATISGLQHSKVILVGTAYAGSLVTWMRQAHPELVDFAWASSAPLKAKVDFEDFKVWAGFVIGVNGGTDCTDRMNRAIIGMEEHIDAGNRAYVRDQFNLCNGLTNTLDVWSFFSSVSNAVAEIVQTGGPAIRAFCTALRESPIEDDIEAFASLFNDETSQCTDASYVTHRLQMGETDWSSKAVRDGSRQWYYQTCSEFGWYPTSTSESQPFGSKFPVDLNIQMCMDFFNTRFSSASVFENADKTNLLKNGNEPNVENMYFTNGEIDPWRMVGKEMNDFDAKNPSVVFPGYSQSQDLYSISDNDSEYMISTKNRIKRAIRDIVGV